MREELYSRELGWVELLSRAFHVFSVNFGAVIKVMAVIFLPISILQSIILDRMTANSAILNGFLQAGDLMAADHANLMTALMQTVTNELLYFAVVLFLEPVGVIAVAKLTRQCIEKEELSVKRALSEAMALEPTIIVSGIFYAVLVFVASMIILPGIYLSIAWCLYLYCIGLGDRKGWDSLRHSKELVRGRWWRTFGYYVLLSVISMLWNSVFELIYTFGEANTAKDILYYFLCYFSGSFVATGMALLFLNREALAGGLRFGRDGVIDGQAVEKEEKEG